MYQKHSEFCPDEQQIVDAHTKVNWTDISKKDVEFSI